MAIADQLITDKYAIYNGDCIEAMQELPDESIDMVVYSPPFGGLYIYSSDIRDLSNSIDRDEFFYHYDFVVKETHRILKPGRMACVHAMDLPTGNTGLDAFYDFPGDIIRQHMRLGFEPVKRHHVWKEPLAIRNRTMTKALSHKMLTEDSTRTSIAHADQLLIFRRSGINAVPVSHPHGLMEYAGERPIPHDLMQYRGYEGNQIENRFSHWIWRQYASAFWDDVRLDHVLPFREAKDEGDEKHCHPLQLDVIERCVILYSNVGETVLTPFMGVGSEVYMSVKKNRRAIGIELKPSYYRQSVRNLEVAAEQAKEDIEQPALF